MATSYNQSSYNLLFSLLETVGVLTGAARRSLPPAGLHDTHDPTVAMATSSLCHMPNSFLLLPPYLNLIIATVTRDPPSSNKNQLVQTTH